MTQIAPNSEPETPNSESFFTPRRFALLLGLLVFASWSDVLLGAGSFVLRDYSVFGYPIAHYHRECFWRGELPLWNPLNNCGIPFLAQWNTMTLYPGTLCYLLLPLPWSLGLFMLLHLWLGGLGAYAVARRWTGLNFAAAVAGVAYAFHGLMQQSLMWPNNIAAFGLLPWVVLTVETGVREGGRKLVLAALVGALQMLTGAPEVIVFTWVIIAALATGRVFRGQPESAVTSKGATAKTEHWMLNTEHFRLLSLTALVTLLAAAQLLPFLDLLRHSQRDANFGGSAWSLPAWGLANFLVPLYRSPLTALGFPLPIGQNWTSSYYAGAGVLALALLAVLRVSNRRARCLALLSAICVVFALGDAGFLHTWLNHLLPLGIMRFPVKFVIPLTFILPMLAAFAVQELIRDHAARRRLCAISAALIAGVVLIALLDWRNPIASAGLESRLLLLGSASAGSVFLVFTVAAVLNFRNAQIRLRCFFWSLAVLGLVFADLRTHVPNLTPRVLPGFLQPGQPDLQALTPQPREGVARAALTRQALNEFNGIVLPKFHETLLLQRLGLFANLNLLDGLAKVDGIFSLYLREQQEVETQLLRGGQTNSLSPPLADFLGIAHVSSPTNIFKWHRRDTALTLITAGQRPLFAAAGNTLPALIATDWSPATIVFLPSLDLAKVSATNATPAKIMSSNWAAHRIACEVESAAPTLVVLAQSFYHPWKATVNGQPTDILRANHAFQAVPIPAGRSVVHLEYVDHRFQIGMALSAFGLALCGVLWWRSKPSPARVINH